MWGSRHRKMVCRANRGDGGPEERQDAVPPMSKAICAYLEQFEYITTPDGNG